MSLRRNSLVLTLSVLVSLIAPAASHAISDDPNIGSARADGAHDKPQITTPESGVLRKRIDFWIKIYTQYSTQEGLIHDAKYPEIVFEKIDLRTDHEDYSVSDKVRRKRAQKRLDNIKEFYRKTLLSIHAKQLKKQPLSDAEKRVVELYKDVDEPNKFYAAAHNKRIRFQLGQKDRFLQGLFYSGRYLPIMEKVFREHGVPVEITRLPFVESSFNLKARSKVGASGIWQFMRSTGKLYLKINDTIDERNDPIRATEAAAQLLKLNHESLGSWPLAITAYNHGRKGLMRAVRKVGSEALDDIIESYRSRSFGFASSNFFCEFMAAYEVEHNASKYFGKFEREKPVEFSEFVMNDFVNARDLATYTRIPMDTLMELNPGLANTIWEGQRLVPAGYVLRIPPDMKDKFLARYNEIPVNKKFASQKSSRIGLTTRKIARGRN